ncbi:hypothetical protein [Ralstonia sp. 1138]|uniref:hypothetical protein n=1 Tax=Ralstonia sp. 1138 TaxID=3156423 RepID=UPI0033952646
MDTIQPQGLLVAACLIGCTVFAVTLCIKVLPDPSEDLSALEQVHVMRDNTFVVVWVVLAGTSIIVGHVIGYYVLGPSIRC